MARSEEEKRIYKRYYPEATGAYDLYILFLLLGELLSKGIFTWIIPNKFLVADYAKKTKSHLVNKGLKLSVDVSLYDVFKTASVYPIILIGNKHQNYPFIEYRLDAYDDLLYNRLIAKDKSTSVQTSRLNELDLKTCSGATGFEAQRIKEFVKVTKGINCIPFTVSGNIDRYAYNNRNVRYMKSSYDPAFIELDSSIASSKIQMWKMPKIVIAGMTKTIEAVYVEEPLAIGVGVYAIYDFGGYNPFYITGVLNSKVVTEYLTKEFYDKHLAGGYLAINKSTIEQILLPKDISYGEQSRIADLVMRIQSLKRDNVDCDTSQYEQEIESIVSKFYSLE